MEEWEEQSIQGSPGTRAEKLLLQRIHQFLLTVYAGDGKAKMNNHEFNMIMEYDDNPIAALAAPPRASCEAPRIAERKFSPDRPFFR